MSRRISAALIVLICVSCSDDASVIAVDVGMPDATTDAGQVPDASDMTSDAAVTPTCDPKFGLVDGECQPVDYIALHFGNTKYLGDDGQVVRELLGMIGCSWQANPENEWSRTLPSVKTDQCVLIESQGPSDPRWSGTELDFGSTSLFVNSAGRTLDYGNRCWTTSADVTPPAGSDIEVAVSGGRHFRAFSAKAKTAVIPTFDPTPVREAVPGQPVQIEIAGGRGNASETLLYWNQWDGSEVRFAVNCRFGPSEKELVIPAEITERFGDFQPTENQIRVHRRHQVVVQDDTSDAQAIVTFESTGSYLFRPANP